MGGPQYNFRDAGFSLFEGRDSGFLTKIGARLGIEVCTGCGMLK